MEYLTWAAIGLVAGTLARVLHPGKDPGGCVVTPLLGIGGALVGGFAARELGLAGIVGFDLHGVVLATLGALLLLVLYRMAFGKKRD